ncbi:MAG: RcpC/CpaB family pilus assembly protein [Acidimicrobiia bacterium]|nr:RcpC/CpaB family pilus assembly protein [Acidimicrobiia bacterium]
MGRRTLVLVIAVLLAAVSGYALFQYLTSVEDDIRADISEVVVYRASADIPTRTPGEDAQINIVESTALRQYVVFEGSTILCLGAAGENASKDPNEFGCVGNPSDLASVLNGNVAAGPIAKNQLITLSSFVDISETEQILSESIAPGKVAIAISVDVVKSSGGFIRPGDNVNIIASTTLSPFSYISMVSNEELRSFFFVPPEPDSAVDPNNPDDSSGVSEQNVLLAALPTSYDITETIFQEIQVLAVGTNTRPAPEPVGLTPTGGTFVFEVTPQQAEQIEYAANYSGLALSLLPSDGTYVPYDAQPVVVDDIFGLLDRISAELGLVLGDQ